MKYMQLLALNECLFGLGDIDLYHGFPTPPCNTVITEGERFINRFFYVVKGSIVFELESGQGFTATAGDIVYLPYGAPYHSWWEQTAESEFVNLLFDMFDKNGQKIVFADKISVIYKDTTNKFVDSFYKMHSIYHARTVNWNLVLKSEFCDFLEKLVHEISYNFSDTSGFRAAINSGIIYLENNYMQNIPVKVLADKSNVSESTFRRNFIKLKGVSPVAYRNELRLSHAHGFLSSGLFTVAEAAEMVGMTDLPYFSKSFKKRFKITPTECIWLSKRQKK